MALTPEQELAKAKEEYETVRAQAKARYDKVRARHTAAARKLDTRRKIILGGALIDMASRDEKVAGFVKRLIEKLPRDQDKKVFEEWDVSAGDDDGKSGVADSKNDERNGADSTDAGSSNMKNSDGENQPASDGETSSSPERVLSYYEQQKRDRP